MMVSQRDMIVDFIRRFPGRDDDEISKTLKIFPRQSVNQACRALLRIGHIERRSGPSGKLANYPVGSATYQSTSVDISTYLSSADSVPDDWFWEGHVTDQIAESLKKAGWIIVSKADTVTKQRGLDLHAEKGGIDLMIEVKGYPSIRYRDQRRSSETKPTNPTNQAQHWFSHAVLKALRLKTAHPNAVIAIGFPNFPRYQTLFSETRSSLEKIGVAVLFVGQNGEVTAHGFRIQ
jgi:hypothetical protein